MGLPRVLIVGDSISMGFHDSVVERLRGVADVRRPAVNCSSSKVIVASLGEWLQEHGPEPWSVVHFNCGLHDLDVKGWGWPEGEHQVGLEDYVANLHRIVDALTATGAQLVFCTTTPAPHPHTLKRGEPPDPSWPTNPIQYRAADVPKYNEAALAVVTERSVPVHDLHAFALPRLPEIQLPEDVHFHDEGSSVLAESVEAAIRAALARAEAAPKL